jgi:hypothetical protein
MRENHAGGLPRDPNDILCGREIDARFLVLLQRNMNALKFHLRSRSLWNDHISKDFGAILMMLVSITHLRFQDLPLFQTDRVAVNLQPRKAFVANSLTLSKFKQTILRNHLLVIKHEHISQIILAVIQAATDIAHRFIHHTTLHNHPHDTLAHDHVHVHVHDHDHDHVDAPWTTIARSFATELFNLKSYANHELAIIHAHFNSTPSKTLFLHPLEFKLVSIYPLPLTTTTTTYSPSYFPLFNP